MMDTQTQSPLQSQGDVVRLQEHLERLLQERKAHREQIEKLRDLAEQQQEKIRELSRQAV